MLTSIKIGSTTFWSPVFRSKRDASLKKTPNCHLIFDMYWYRGSAGSVSTNPEFNGSTPAIISGISFLLQKINDRQRGTQWRYLISEVESISWCKDGEIRSLTKVGVPENAFRTYVRYLFIKKSEHEKLRESQLTILTGRSHFAKPYPDLGLIVFMHWLSLFR